MNIRNSYRLFTFSVFLLLTIVGVFVFKALQSQEDVIRGQEHRFKSVMLAIELFQSSEDLTRMARSYVSTGNSIFREKYFEILDIRNGKRPRPQDYSVTYWHLAGMGRGPATAPGETTALRELMRREGFNGQEMDLLRESQVNSDRLVHLEEKAFAAMKGMFDDGQGNYTVRREPDRDYAVRLLFSAEYFDGKAKIMAPIQRFMEVIDRRMRTESSDDQARLFRYTLLALVFTIVVMVVVLIKFIHTWWHILRPIGHLRRQVAEIAAGNYAARGDVPSGNEIGELCDNFNSMAASLQRDVDERQEAERVIRATAEQREKLIGELQSALDNIKTLQGLIPICASCKKVRDDKGYWGQVEEYIGAHTEARFTHGICPECARKLYGDVYEQMEKKRT
ncbi:MAG TPA: HAMP domain-containing protein [Candidatus Aminicenantes bacterium]|nr:HAMP domain-containing protein [Candidatus Aminicenantes bacterium]